MNMIPWKNKLAADWWKNETEMAPWTRLRQEMDRLFAVTFGRTWNELGGGREAMAAWWPTVDVTDTDTEITVRAEVPGVDPKELDIAVAGNTLTIAGEKKEIKEHKGENFHHAERRFGSFRRTIQLPAPVNPEKIKAEDKNGVVFIHLKKDMAAVPKRIPVKAAE